MDAQLKRDLDHMFSVFLNNTLMDLRQLLPPAPEAEKYQDELEQELNSFHAALMKRLEREFTA